MNQLDPSKSHIGRAVHVYNAGSTVFQPNGNPVYPTMMSQAPFTGTIIWHPYHPQQEQPPMVNVLVTDHVGVQFALQAVLLLPPGSMPEYGRSCAMLL